MTLRFGPFVRMHISLTAQRAPRGVDGCAKLFNGCNDHVIKVEWQQWCCERARTLAEVFWNNESRRGPRAEGLIMPATAAALWMASRWISLKQTRRGEGKELTHLPCEAAIKWLVGELRDERTELGSLVDFRLREHRAIANVEILCLIVEEPRHLHHLLQEDFVCHLWTRREAKFERLIDQRGMRGKWNFYSLSYHFLCCSTNRCSGSMEWLRVLAGLHLSSTELHAMSLIRLHCFLRIWEKKMVGSIRILPFINRENRPLWRILYWVLTESILSSIPGVFLWKPFLTKIWPDLTRRSVSIPSHPTFFYQNELNEPPAA